MPKYSLYAVVEREDGSLFRQRIGKVEETITPKQVHEKIQDYLKMLGKHYYVVDWYLDR